MPDISLPYNGWEPRGHQWGLWSYLQSGGKRAMVVWHRRAGKDEVCLHHAAVSMIKRPGNYWHCLPEFLQGRKAIWTAINAHTGKRRIDEAFPTALRDTVSENEMFIRLKNGSTWQIIGSDRYDATVGSGVAGITYSEWALANPSAWGYHRPMLEENNGWGIFITTPRGRNHAKALFDHAQSQPGNWFSERLTALDTKALTADQLDDALGEYQALYGYDVGSAQFRQEYLCDWSAAILGAFYAFEMAAVRNEQRIAEIEAIPGVPVHRAWDLGTRDDTSIWFFQPVGAQLYILDHYAASGVGLEHFRDVIEEKHETHGWKHGTDYVPHDAGHREWTSGRTRIETMMAVGLRPERCPDVSKEDGINAVRRTLPLCVFHPRTEVGGIEALEQYRREWDDEKKTFRASAVHDWCFTGDTEVLTRYGAYQIRNLPETGEVLTPCGWRPYHSPRITRRNARLVAVQFADGLTVRCTPDHLFATASGWKSAECLTSTSPIQSSLTFSRSILMAACIGYGRVKSITRAAARDCIAMFGLGHLETSLAGVTSITKIATRLTTGSTISNASRLQNIYLSHLRIAGRAARQGDGFWIRRETLLPNGTGRIKDAYGIHAMPSNRRGGSSGSVRSGLVHSAEGSSTLSFARAVTVRSFAALCVRLQHGAIDIQNTIKRRNGVLSKGRRWLNIASVKKLSETADVWCLSVPDSECFSLANGAVVHNCSHPSDAFRYLSLSWRKPATKEIRTLRPTKPVNWAGSWIIPPPREPRRGEIVV